MGRSPTHRLGIAWEPVVPPGVWIALRALRRASRLGKGIGCVLALLATIGHAEERSHEPVASGVLYVSATVVSDDAGGLARPFAAVGKSDQGRSVAAGLRYEALGGQPWFVGEFTIGHRRGGGFVMARFEARR